jgi:CBS domain containing-hemolysin-like protein
MSDPAHSPSPTPTESPGPTDEPRSSPETRGAGLLDRLRGLIGGWRSSGSLRTDLAEVLASSSVDATTDLSVTERAMLKNILDLRELRVGDVMVPRADIIAVQKDIVLGELLAVFADAGHSRLVVYDDTLDDPVGMVHIRDLVAYLTQRAMTPRRKDTGYETTQEAGTPDEPVHHVEAKGLLPAFNLKAIDLGASLGSTKLIRRLLFVPPSMPSIELLASMQASRIHLALVIDEYGGTDGIVSMEDLVEEIVGDIEDEHDDEETPLIARQADGSFIADARAGLEEVAEEIDPAFAMGEEAEEVDTLGGLLVTLAGRVPVRGEIVAGPGAFEIEVLDADPRRVKRLRIVRAREGARHPVRRPDQAAGQQGTRPQNGEPARGSLPAPAEQQSASRPALRDPDAA